MSAAETPAPTTQPSRSGRLLALVRKLIDYSRELAATIRQRTAADPGFAKARFGTPIWQRSSRPSSGMARIIQAGVGSSFLPRQQHWKTWVPGPGPGMTMTVESGRDFEAVNPLTVMVREGAPSMSSKTS